MFKINKAYIVHSFRPVGLATMSSFIHSFMPIKHHLICFDRHKERERERASEREREREKERERERKRERENTSSFTGIEKL